MILLQPCKNARIQLKITIWGQYTIYDLKPYCIEVCYKELQVNTEFINYENTSNKKEIITYLKQTHQLYAPYLSTLAVLCQTPYSGV